jgi:hypothetical protein
MAYHGKKGNLVYDGVNIANLQSYSLTRIGETADATAMGDTWDKFNAGLTDFNATAEGLSQVALDTTALIGGGGPAEFSFQDAGVNGTAAVIITGITETAVVDDNISISYSFEGNDTAGIVTATTGEAAATASTNTIHGKQLNGTWGVTPTAFADVVGWTVTMSCPVSDATAAHATNCGRVKLAGTNNATATVTILTPATDLVILEGVSGALNLFRSATATDGRYEGTAICTGSETGVDRTGTETTTMSFIYTGEVDLVITA